MLKCKRCREKFEIGALDDIDKITGQATLAMSCPKCGQLTSVAQKDAATELDIELSEVIEYRDNLVKKLEEEDTEAEMTEEPKEAPEPDYHTGKIDMPEQSTEVRTPLGCLKTVIENDPMLNKSDCEWLLSVAENIYGGTMTINDLVNKVKQLHKKGTSKNILAERVSDDYVSLINTVLNNNPEYLKDEAWIDFLKKEPRAPNPEHVKDPGKIRIRKKGEPEKDPGEQLELGDVDLNKFLNDQMNMMKKINIIKAMGGGKLPPEIENVVNNPNMAVDDVGNEGDGDLDVDVNKLLNSYLQNQMILNLTNSMRGGMMSQGENDNGREAELEMERQEHEERMEMMRQKHEKEMKKLDEEIKQTAKKNSSRDRRSQKRLATREQRETPRRKRSNPEEEINKYISTMKKIESEFNRGNESNELRKELAELRKRMEGGLNEGEFNQYDAEVKKAQAEVNGKTKQAELEHQAKMKEAEERRKGMETVAGAFERGIGNLGREIGIGLVSGEPMQEEGMQEESMQGQPEYTESPLRKEMDEDGNETGNLVGECPMCGEDVVIEEGQTEIVCDNCNATLNPVPEK